MVYKRLVGLVFAGAMIFSAAAADIVVRIAPPRVVIEKRTPSPGRTYVWTSGYDRWDGNAYSWNAGTWQQPPRPGAHWVAHRWNHQKDGWVFAEGHWR
jgi:hypothetical protein